MTSQKDCTDTMNETKKAIDGRLLMLNQVFTDTRLLLACNLYALSRSGDISLKDLIE